MLTSVLDEADRLLDMGFLPALKAIVNHFSPQRLPDGRPDRQTMLFSATQSRDLAALAKLSLHEPLYINCNKPGEEGVVPAKLEQYYSVVPLERKLDALWGFVKAHLKMKGVVFVTTGKQVRFIFETFRRLHPGLPLVHLLGKQKQATRMAIFQKFSTSKHALLICTDIAARGLDFPAVDWVIQLDCPEDVDTYIHRVGRTARYQSEGKSLLFLLPSEQEGMETRWKEKAIEPTKMKIRDAAMGNLKQQMQNFSFREPEIKYLGQRVSLDYDKWLTTGLRVVYAVYPPAKGQDYLQGCRAARRGICGQHGPTRSSTAQARRSGKGEEGPHGGKSCGGGLRVVGSQRSSSGSGGVRR